MRPAVLAGLLCIAACAPREAPSTASPRVRPAPAPSAPAPAPAAPAPPPSVQPPVAALPIDLGPHVLGRAFVPGRYAADVHKSLSGTHARNWVTEQTRTSFVLNLDPDGQASACRGKRSQTFNDGPTVHTSSSLREQQGYRGRWSPQGGWLEVDLALDGEVCPQQRAYTNLEPKPWRLRCLMLQPKGHAVLTVPALACRLENEKELLYHEGYAHLVPAVLDGEWLMLGSGNGLRITLESDSVPPPVRPPSVTVGASPDRVVDATWAQP